MGRLITCGSCPRLAEGSEKKRPLSADICLKVSEPTTRYFGRLPKATTSPDNGIGQLREALPDLPAITEIDVNFERFTEIGKRRVPSFKTSLGDRKAR